MVKQTLIVVGGGAAGFFCAIHAAEFNPSLQVTILEKTSKILSKVRISGGGRCNVTHAGDSISGFIKSYPRGNQFVKKSFQHFFVHDTINWFVDRGVELKTEADGRIFPVSNSSESIINSLVSEVNKHKIELLLNRDVRSVTYQTGKWLLVDQDAKTYHADFLCIAAGGHHKLSKFSWLSGLSLATESPVPSLFTFNVHNHQLKDLMGLSVANATVKIKATKFAEDGPLLITHWGFSGPAVLKLSAYAAIDLFKMNYDFTIVLNWLPQYNETSMQHKLLALKQELLQQKIKNKNTFNLPARLWEFLVNSAGINPNEKWDNIPAKSLNILGKILCSSEYAIKGKTTFKEEFVTAGGIDVIEINADTMGCKKWRDLFFAGEIINVDGITGGYNFQHAWTSGYIAGKSIGLKSGKTEETLII